MDEDLKTRFKAEVRAMRAWTYLNLTTTFGKVPLITDVLSYDAPNIPRDETSKIREFILNELTEAAAILPEKYAGSYPNEKGRMTKYAALAVKQERPFISATIRQQKQQPKKSWIKEVFHYSKSAN